ncbi:MAG: hypothetical protein R2838_05120 [Caldilineaceae bacterium]
MESEVAYGRAQRSSSSSWWTRPAGVPGYVSGRRHAATGANNGNPFAIAYDAAEERVAPDVAYNLSRNEYLVTYHNGVDIFGLRGYKAMGASWAASSVLAGWPSTEFNPAIASVTRPTSTWWSGRPWRRADSTTSMPAL